MKRTLPLPTTGTDLALTGVVVRLIRPAELRRWTRLMVQHHYLGNAHLVGEVLRYVAERQGRWVALLGWSSAAYHLRLRERHLGWSSTQRQRRLSLLACNARFLILPDIALPNLASHVLAACTRRLSEDWQAAHGHGVLFVETFVDPQRFEGTCYRAAGWLRLGASKGFARRTRDYYLPHDHPKELFVKALHPRALQWLHAPHLPQPWAAAEKTLPPQPGLRLPQWQSLYELFADLPDARSPHGRLHSVRTIVTIAAAAVLAGARGYLAIAEFAARLTQRQLAAVRAYVNPKTDRRVAPSYNAIWRVLTHLDADGLDQCLHQWFSQLDPHLKALAVDGKTLRSTAGPEGKPLHLLAALCHETRATLAQTPVPDKTNEITALPALLAALPLDDVVVTADALHTQRDTARFLVCEKGADYLLVVKDNQPTLHRKLQRLLPQSAFSPSTHTP
jgi:hypothetical protein